MRADSGSTAAAALMKPKSMHSPLQTPDPPPSPASPEPASCAAAAKARNASRREPAGIARYPNADVTLVRVIIAALVLFTGVGAALYIAACC